MSLYKRASRRWEEQEEDNGNSCLRGGPRQGEFIKENNVTPDSLLDFLDRERSELGDMTDVEKAVYSSAIKGLAKFHDKPHITRNCKVHLIIPGEPTKYTVAFQSGAGANVFIATANEKGEASDLIWTHKSSKVKAKEIRWGIFFAIFLSIVIGSAVIAGLLMFLKSHPMKARLDGVLHSRLSIMDENHDPYTDPAFPESDFVRGKLY